jgi:hypothetical protein
MVREMRATEEAEAAARDLREQMDAWMREFERRHGRKPDFKEFLRYSPGPDLSLLDLERDRSLPRDIEL